MSALPEIADSAPSESPFLLLNFYQQKDAYRFAGRDDEINAVVTGVLSFDTFVLYGRSGLGKTSLLLAGVFPELEKRGFKPVYSRVLDLPVAELRKKIDAEIAAQTGSIILVLDQFEEFFIRVREENENQPARRLAACREMAAMLADVQRRSAGRVRLLFGIREDYYAELDDFRSEMPAIAAHGFRLLPVTAYGARRAIILMLEYAHPPVAYDQKFLSLLLDEVARTGFDPLLLQIMCVEVWRDANAKRPGTNELRAEDFENVGGFEQIFQRYVERAAAAASDPLLVRVLLDTLITAEQTKRVVRSRDLASQLYIRTKQEDIDALLQQLVDLQLVRPVGESHERYELLHDRLVPVVKKWLEGDKYFVDFRFAKKFIDSMATGGDFRTNVGRLISEEQMSQLIERFALYLQLTPDETELLFRSSVLAGDRDATPFWASRLDEIAPDRSTEIVRKMFESTDPRVRAGAARAVRELQSGQVFVPTLLDMVVKDFGEVSEVAAKSFAALASDDDLALVAQYTKDRRSRERATAIVVECYDQLRPTNIFPLSVRHRAWRAVRKRSAATQGEWIRDAMGEGAIRGAIAGGLWAMTIAGAIWIAVQWNAHTDWVIGGTSDPLTWAMILGVFGAASGALMGWAASRREARREAVARWELFYGGPTRSIRQTLAIFGLSLLAWAAFLLPSLQGTRYASSMFAIALLGVAVTLIVIFARQKDCGPTSKTIWLRLHRAWPWIVLSLVAVAAARLPTSDFTKMLAPSLAATLLSVPIAAGALRLRRYWSGEKVAWSVVWTWIGTGGVTLFGTIAILWLVESVNRDAQHPRFLVLAGIAVVALGLGCFRAAVLAAAVEGLVKGWTPSERVRIASRSAGVLLIVLALAGYLALFGVHSVPLLAEEKVLGRDDLTGEHLRVLAKAHYYRITGVSDHTRFVQISGSSGTRIGTSADYSVYLTGDNANPPIYFAARPFLLSVDAFEGGRAYRVHLGTHPLGTRQIGEDEVFVGEIRREKQWSFAEYDPLVLQDNVILWDRDSGRCLSEKFMQTRDATFDYDERPIFKIGSANIVNVTKSQISVPLQPAKLTVIALKGYDASGRP